jgi:hypothetical protein
LDYFCYKRVFEPLLALYVICLEMGGFLGLLSLLLAGVTTGYALSEDLATTFLEVHTSAEADRARALGQSFDYLSSNVKRREDPPADAPSAGTSGDVSPAPSAGAVAGGQDDCDVCTYVLQNKELLQPYLCRGLNTPSQQLAVRLLVCSQHTFL